MHPPVIPPSFDVEFTAFLFLHQNPITLSVSFLLLPHAISLQLLHSLIFEQSFYRYVVCSLSKSTHKPNRLEVLTFDGGITEPEELTVKIYSSIGEFVALIFLFLQNCHSWNLSTKSRRRLLSLPIFNCIPKHENTYIHIFTGCFIL